MLSQVGGCLERIPVERNHTYIVFTAGKLSTGLLDVHLPRLRHHIHCRPKRSAQGKTECEVVNGRAERDTQGSTNTDSRPRRINPKPQLLFRLFAHGTPPWKRC